jgi:hypothetical protein
MPTAVFNDLGRGGRSKGESSLLGGIGTARTPLGVETPERHRDGRAVNSVKLSQERVP